MNCRRFLALRFEDDLLSELSGRCALLGVVHIKHVLSSEAKIDSHIDIYMILCCLCNNLVVLLYQKIHKQITDNSYK